MAQTVIGLDIGSYSVKAAVVETGLRKYQWVGFGEHLWNRNESGEPVDEDLSDAVTAVLEDVNDRNAIVTSIPGAKLLNRELTLPFSNEKEIRNVLDFELDGQYPLPIEDLVYDYTVLEREPGGGSKLLCSAVEREWFETFLSELGEAGANPRIVCMDTLAARELVEHAGGVSAYAPPEETDAIALIDVGHMTTSLCVVRGDVVEMVRTIRRGGHHITKALMERLSLSYQEAEEFKHAHVRLDQNGVSHDDPTLAEAIQTAVLQTLTPLVRELRTTLHAHANRHVIGVVRGMIYGGCAKLPGLREMFEEALELQLERPRCFSFPWTQEGIGDEGEEIAPKAVSLALRYVTDGQKDSVNFRQGDLAFESEFKALKDKGLWLGILAVLFIAILFARIAVEKSVLEDNQEKLAQKLGDYTEEHFGERMSSFQAALGRVQSPPKSEGDDVAPPMTGFRAYYEIWQATNIVKEMKMDDDKETSQPSGTSEEDSEEETEEDYSIQIERISLPAYSKVGQVQGTVTSLKAMTAFQELLDKHPCMELTADPDYSAGSVGRRATFTMRLKIECEEGAKNDQEEKAKSGEKATGKTGKSATASEATK